MTSRKGNARMIFGVAVFVGIIAYAVSGLTPWIPGLENEVNGTDAYSQFERDRQELGILINDSAIGNSSMVLDTNFSDSPTGNAIYWNNNTNDRGDDYGYIQYNVSNINTIEIEYSSPRFDYSLRAPIRVYLSNSTNGTFYQEAEFYGDGTREVSLVSDSTEDQAFYGDAGPRILEIRDYGEASGEVFGFAVPARSPGAFSAITAVLNLSSDNRWFQYLIGIPISILLLYVGISYVIPFIGSSS